MSGSWTASPQDVPPDDGNPCTDEVCTPGGPSHVPSPAGKACGPALVCSGTGRCGACVAGEARCVPTGRETCDLASAWKPSQPCDGPCSGGKCVSVEQLAPGLEHTCALLSDHSVVCWGDNHHGAAGVGREPAVLLSPRPVPVGAVVQLAPGPGMHTCARLASGAVMCWGLNDHGQLGAPSSGGLAPLPILVPGLSNAVDVATGAAHSCSALADGAVWCWGSNDAGQLGDGTRVEHGSPVRVKSLPPAARVAAGDQHTCALLRDHTVRCWGSNVAGESGSGAHDDYGTYAGPLKVGDDAPAPAAVEGLSGVQSITAGFGQSCALLDSGAVKCWGGQSFRPKPQEIKGLKPASAVGAAGRHVCALLRTGTVSCWGTNEHGQLGDGTRKNHGKPALVQGMQQVVQLAVGREHACARQQDGAVQCWGSNAGGKLGDGTRESRLLPTRLKW